MTCRIEDVVEQFHIEGTLTEIIPWGNGLINDTFRIKTTKEEYLLQRMNEHAYQDIPGMIDNIWMVTDWILRSDYYYSDGRKKPKLRLIMGKNGARFDRELYNSYKKGFLEGTKGILTKAEEESLDKGAVLIVAESAMRYLADYLNGDIYLKVSYPKQNLVKARMHLKLAENMCQKLLD